MQIELAKIDRIKPDLMVHALGVEAGAREHGVPGVHVGTVDHLEGSKFIKLKKNDSADGRHRWIPLEWVSDVDDKAVYLNKTPDEVSRGQLAENPLNRH